MTLSKKAFRKHCEKEKILVTSIFSFFAYYVATIPKTYLKFESLLKPSPKQALVFTCLRYMSFESNVGNGEIAHNEQLLHFPHWFLLV